MKPNRLNKPGASIAGTPEEEAARVFARVAPNDPRRLRRAQKTFAGVLRKPGAAVPELSPKWAGATAAYDIAANEKPPLADILAGAAAATLERIRAQPDGAPVLLLNDTTALNYSGLREVDGPGPIGHNPGGPRGLFVHPHFCIDAGTGGPPGLHGARVWSRNTGHFGGSRTGKRNRLPLAGKESGRWLDAYASAEQLHRDLGGAREVICVSDREGDIYEIFAHRRRTGGGAHLLVRQQHDRALCGGGGKKAQRNEGGPEDKNPGPHDEGVDRAGAAGVRRRSRGHLQKRKPAGEIIIRIEARAGRRAREARLEVRHACVELAAPWNAAPGDAGAEPLRLWLVSALEAGPPAGEAPVEWHLWSTRPAGDFARACELLHYYSLRWQIEILFRVCKQVCRVESRQLRTVRGLCFFALLDLPAAIYIMALSLAARTHPGSPAGEWFDEPLWRAMLAETRGVGAARAAVVPPPLGEVVFWLGRLGGHPGRKSDLPCGPLRLHRGLREAHALARAWQLFAHYNEGKTSH
ncbi:MAG: IS4 family transposase [Opitutaceae bacterium]|jgi:hypothetical protein|nr:IS4 family transposase [Opitutaceae bacterium]